jgi:hypothetical protein
MCRSVQLNAPELSEERKVITTLFMNGFTAAFLFKVGDKARSE